MNLINKISWQKSNSDLTTLISSDFWSDPDGYIDKHAVVVKKSGYHRKVFSFKIDQSDKQILVKHFVFSTLIEKLKWKFGKSAAHKEWNLLNYLSDNGVPTPKPLALGLLNNQSSSEAWLLIEFVENAVTFDQVRPPKSIKETLSAARELAKTIAKLHFAAVHHGDLHSGNLLYIPQNPLSRGVAQSAGVCNGVAEGRGGSNSPLEGGAQRAGDVHGPRTTDHGSSSSNTEYRIPNTQSSSTDHGPRTNAHSTTPSLHDSNSPSWLITDFQRSKQHCFSRSDFVSDLVQLNHCLGKKVRPGVRAVFIKTYLEKFDELTKTENEVADWEWKNLFKEIGVKARLYSIHQAKIRCNRCENSNRDFAALNDILPDNKYILSFENAWVHRGASKQLIDDLVNLVSDENWLLNAEITIIKNRPSVAVGVWAHPHGSLFIKQYRYRKSLREKILEFLHKSKSHRNWKSVWRLRHLHINTPKPLLVAWTPTGGVIVWEHLSNSITSEAALLRYSQSNHRKQRMKLIRETAVQLALLHNRGAEHGDLKSSNLLILDVDGKNPKVYFTDVDAAKFYRHLPWARRVRDLARLYAALYSFLSSPEIRYFLRIYLKRQNEDIDIRQLIVSVQDRAEKKIIQKSTRFLATN